jgi:hypothetical protein
MEATTVSNIDIPDGNYKGLWSGYEIVIEGFEHIDVKTSVGMKGFDIPCVIKVKNKEARIKSLL